MASANGAHRRRCRRVNTSSPSSASARCNIGLASGVGPSAGATLQGLPLGEAAGGDFPAIAVAAEAGRVGGAAHEGVELGLAGADQSGLAAAQTAGHAGGALRTEAERGGLAIRQAARIALRAQLFASAEVAQLERDGLIFATGENAAAFRAVDARRVSCATHHRRELVRARPAESLLAHARALRRLAESTGGGIAADRGTQRQAVFARRAVRIEGAAADHAHAAGPARDAAAARG